VIATLILLTTLAQASAPAVNPQAKLKAKTLLGEGTRLYESGEFAPALEKFTQAYTEYASPKLLYNIAQTQRALGRLAEAMESLERFLLDPPDDSPEMTADAHTAMAEIQAKLGRLRIDCNTTRAEISVDGKMVGLAPLKDMLWAAPGKHQITARHPDMIPIVQDAEVAVGSIRNVELTLVSLAAQETGGIVPVDDKIGRSVANSEGRPSRLPASEVTVGETRNGDDGPRSHRVWTWVAGGTTVALVGAATVLSLATQSKFNSLNESCGSKSTGWPSAGCSESEISSVTGRRNTANVLWALSGAAAVTTGVLFFVEGRRVDVAPVVAGSPGLTARIGY
jgi:hypothetical protein